MCASVCVCALAHVHTHTSTCTCTRHCSAGAPRAQTQRGPDPAEACFLQDVCVDLNLKDAFVSFSKEQSPRKCSCSESAPQIQSCEMALASLTMIYFTVTRSEVGDSRLFGRVFSCVAVVTTGQENLRWRFSSGRALGISS